jgi:hypothetical protein
MPSAPASEAFATLNGDCGNSPPVVRGCCPPKSTTTSSSSACSDSASDGSVSLERDLWILVFATHPDTARELFRDQAEALTDPTLRQIYLDYDRAYDLDPLDPSITDLARRIIDATRQRYGTGDLPGQTTSSEIPKLIQGAVNASSSAWQRLDSLIRDELRRPSEGSGDVPY